MKKRDQKKPTAAEPERVLLNYVTPGSSHEVLGGVDWNRLNRLSVYTKYPRLSCFPYHVPFMYFYHLITLKDDPYRF